MKNRTFPLQERVTAFSVNIILMHKQIKTSEAGRHIGKQLMRAATSVALNYAEATAAESRKDFIHKMKVGLKELRETNVCLEIICQADLIKSQNQIEKLQTECDELSAIFASSIKTAMSNILKGKA